MTKRKNSLNKENLLVELFRKKPIGAFGFVMILLFVFIAIFAGKLAPYPLVNGKFTANILERLIPPFADSKHILGTDSVGRDLLSYCIYGARTSVILCFGCSLISICISVLLGTLSAVIGGWFDLVLQRFVDAWQCIPSMLLMLLMISFLGNGMPQMIIAMSVPSGIGGSRMMRSAAISLKNSGYMDSSEMLGAGIWWKTVRHVIPNIMPLIITGLAGSLGGVIMMEASLSFLGFGIGTSVASWGYILTEQGRANMYIAPWLSTVPGALIALMVFSANMLGDGVRDVLDPRLKGGVGSYSKKKLTKVLKKYLSKEENGIKPNQYMFIKDENYLSGKVKK